MEKDKSYLIFLSAGLELAISVVAGLIFGWYMDGKLNTKPWLAITGIIIGSIAGFYNFWRIVKISSKF